MILSTKQPGENTINNTSRILVVCQHYWPESFRINDIVDYFIEQQCEVDVLCGLPNYPRGEFFEGYGYFGKRKDVHRQVNIRRVLEIKRGSNSNIRIFLNYISFPFFSVFHIPKLLTIKYDKIFLYQLSPVMMTIPGIIIGKLTKTETTMYVLDLWPENLYSVFPVKNRLMDKIITKISHWHYKNVDKLIVLSSAMKDRLVEVTGISDDKIIILPQACEKVYEAKVHDKQLAAKFKKGFNIVYTGNISPAQSFQTIIEAALLLKNQGIEDINWIIVGDGMSKKWLVNSVEENNLSNNFHFEGQKPINDIPKYTDIADVLVGCLVKSDLLEATIPAKVMSYLAAGKPLVLAMDGEVQKLINEAIRCGFVCPTEDSSNLAYNISIIYNMKPNDRNALGNNARRYHFNNFERNIILNKLFRFIIN